MFREGGGGGRKEEERKAVKRKLNDTKEVSEWRSQRRDAEKERE